MRNESSLYNDCDVYILYHKLSEIYCYGPSKEEAFDMIHKDYTKDRSHNELVEMPKPTLEEFIEGYKKMRINIGIID